MDWLRKQVSLGQRAPFPGFPGELDDKTREEAFTALLAHFDLHQSRGQRGCAREVLELAGALAENGPDLTYRWMRKWARWLESVGRRNEALELLQHHLRRLRGKLANPTRSAELRMELGIMLDRAGRKEESLKFFKDAAQRYKKLKHNYNHVAALFNSASVLHDLGQFGDALRYCRKALAEGAASHNDLSSHIALQMANSTEQQQQFQEASTFYRQAEESYGQIGNRRQQSDILYRLGWLAVRSKRLPEGMRFLRSSLELKREQDYAIGLTWYHWARAEAYRSGGALKKALQHYRSALNLALRANQDGIAAHCRVVLFRLHSRPDQSLSLYLRYGNPSAADSIVKQGRAGLYLDHFTDGYSLDVFREPGDSPRAGLDRKLLSRLVNDLERITRATGVLPGASLERQRVALSRWLERQQKK